MARKLTGQIADAMTAMPEEPSRTVAEGKWLPYTTPEALPKAEFVEKKREIRNVDGTVAIHKTLQIKKKGDPRYFVTNLGELIAVRRAPSGIQRKMVYQFKRSYPDTPLGQQRQIKDTAFRKMLKQNGVPGA